MIDIGAICATVVRLSVKHEVDPLAVVGLLAVHALVAVDFTRLHVWRMVADNLSGKA